MVFWTFAKELDQHQNSCEKCALSPKIRKIWGCEDNSDLPEHKRTLYRLGEFETYKCPLKTMKSPFVERAADLFSFFEKGILPNARLDAETACYRKVMSLLEVLKSQAQTWYEEEKEKRRKNKK